MKIQGLRVSDLAKHYRTPLYLYDADCIKNAYDAVRNCFGKAVDVFFSLKANPNISIAHFLFGLGACAEVCSLSELEVAILAGAKPENIIFVGPAKSAEEIQVCIHNKIYAIVCESFEELEYIENLAQAADTVVSVALRINPNFVSKSALLKMGGKPTQFGIDQAEFYERFSQYMQRKHIHIRGIHIYNGTRILNHETIFENTESILKIAENIQAQFKVRFEMVDFGGGLGIPYFDNEAPLDMAALQMKIQPLIADYLVRYPGTRLILEAGRYLVAESGIMVSQVEMVKVSHHENFIVTNGGTNCHMAAVGIGSFAKRNFPISLIPQQPQVENAIYHVTGPLCTPVDLVAKAVSLPLAHQGDWVVIHRSGAYGPTASPGLFLSHGYPAEVLVRNGEALLIRERDTPADIRKKQFLV